MMYTHLAIPHEHLQKQLSRVVSHWPDMLIVYSVTASGARFTVHGLHGRLLGLLAYHDGDYIITRAEICAVHPDCPARIVRELGRLLGESSTEVPS